MSEEKDEWSLILKSFFNASMRIIELEAKLEERNKRISDLTVRINTINKLQSKYPNRANGCCCLFDDNGNQIESCKYHAEIRNLMSNEISIIRRKIEEIENIAISKQWILQKSNIPLKSKDEKEKMKKENLCVDFDGVIHKYVSKWVSEYVILDSPVDGALEFINEAVKHFNVYIHSTRCGYPDGCEVIYNWLKKYGFPVDKLQYTHSKIPAIMYIDDRGYQFNGIFPSIDFIKNFKTWNYNEKIRD